MHLYNHFFILARFFRNLALTRRSLSSDFGPGRLPRPLILIWESTNRCVARCAYCDFWKAGPESAELLSEAQVKDLMDQAAALGLCCFSISGGGDPLLRDDLGELIRYGRQKRLAVAVTTNGLLISHSNVDYLLQADVITISIDSLDAERNNRRRGLPDYLAKALAGLKLLLRRNTRTYICVQSVLDEENWSEVNAINRYFFDLGIDTLFQPRYNHPFHIPAQEWRSRTARLKYHRRLTHRLIMPFMDRFPALAAGTWRGGCLAGSVAFVVTSVGEMLPCHLRRETAWNLKQQSLASAWTAMQPLRRSLAAAERKCLCGDTAILPYSLLLTR